MSQLIDFVGERAGTRTRDPLIKSHVVSEQKQSVTNENLQTSRLTRKGLLRCCKPGARRQQEPS